MISMLSLCFSSQKGWGVLASDFMTSQWKVVHFYLRNTQSVSRDTFVSMETCIDYLPVSSGEATVILFSCIKILLPLVNNYHQLAHSSMYTGTI